MWDLPAPGIKLVSPALVGNFFTTEPPSKPSNMLLILKNTLRHARSQKHNSKASFWINVLIQNVECSSTKEGSKSKKHRHRTKVVYVTQENDEEGPLMICTQISCWIKNDWSNNNGIYAFPSSPDHWRLCRALFKKQSSSTIPVCPLPKQDSC